MATDRSTFEPLLSVLDSIREDCIEKSKSLTFEDNDFRAAYMCSMYSIAMELAGDCCEGMKARKELSSHVLARALLEAVVDLLNIIKDPKYVNSRFQRALNERKKKLVYLRQNEPNLISASGKDAEYVNDVIGQIDTLRDNGVDQPGIRKRFKDAGMEDYYCTAYALLCDYTHHDASAIINRPIGLQVHRLDDQGILMLSDLTFELLHKSTVAVHKFLKSDQAEFLSRLQTEWRDEYRQHIARVVRP